MKGLIKEVNGWVLIRALSLATAFSGSAYAADIFNGVIGPTNWQADNRITYSKNENGVEKITDNLILKYWDGSSIGKWGFISSPYTSIDAPNSSGEGIGDMSIGFGPRGEIGNLHLFLYGALTLPTGNTDGSIPIGFGRYDVKLGLFTTYLTPDKKYEIDSSSEYRFTGKNKEGINPPNQISLGLLGGGKLTDKTRLVTGLESLMKDDGSHLLSSRTVFRYTVSPSLFFELVGDVGIDTKNIPKGNSITFQIRSNF